MLTFDLPGAEIAFGTTNRCLFCFSKLCSAFKKGKIFPVTKFNEVWNHLVPEEELEFSVTPPLCSNCKKTAEKLYTALIQLTDSTIKIRAVITDAGRNNGNSNGRFGELLEDLKHAGLGDNCKQGALSLLEKLGHDEIFEEDYETWFQDEIKTTQVKKEECYEDTHMMIDHETEDGNLFNEKNAFPHSLHNILDTDSYPVLETDFQPKQKHTVKNSTRTITGKRRQIDSLRKSLRIKENGKRRRILNVNSVSPKAKVKKRKKHAKLPVKQPKPRKKAPIIPNRTSSGPNTFRCDFCLQNVSKPGLLKHVRSHVGDYAISCPNPDCLYVCTTSYQLVVHAGRRPNCRDLISSKKFLTCQTCRHEATCTRSLLKHLLSAHEEDEKSFACPVVDCSEKFSTHQAVRCHIRRHTAFAHKGKGALAAPPSYQKCGVCFQNIRQNKIKVHLATLHGIPSESIITCNYCPYQFSSWKHLLDHLRTHIFNGVSVTCPQCPADTTGAFTKISLLRQHLWDKHQVGSPFQCKLCPHVCWSEAGIVNHIKYIHKNMPKLTMNKKRAPLECDTCSKKLLNRNRLVAHKIQNHGDDLLECQVCGEKFEYPTLLNRHNREVHFGIKRPPSQTLRNTREKITSVLCGQCGKLYKDKNSLNGHVRIMHSKLVFHCNLCGRQFKAKKNLKKHQEKEICKNRAIKLLSNKTIHKYERLRKKGKHDPFPCA